MNETRHARTQFENVSSGTRAKRARYLTKGSNTINEHTDFPRDFHNLLKDLFTGTFCEL